MELCDFVADSTEFQKFLKDLDTSGHHLVTGLFGSARTVFFKTLLNKKNCPILVVTDTLSHAQSLATDLMNIIAEEKVHLFPAEELVATEIATSSPDFKSQRVRALQALSEQVPQIIVTSASGLRRRIPPLEEWQRTILNLKPGMNIDLTKTINKLVQMGYKRQGMVDRPGDFSVRGSIIDVYALNHELPVRIDLFDTEVDSIRYFDIGSQRSIKNLSTAKILPATDFLHTNERLQTAASKLSKIKNKVIDQTTDVEEKTVLQQEIEQTITEWKANEISLKQRIFAQLLYPENTTLLNYLSQSGIVVLDDYAKILEHADEINQNEQMWLKDRGSNLIFTKIKLSHDLREVIKKDDHNNIFSSLFKKGIGRLNFITSDEIKTRAVQRFFSQLPLLKTEAQRWVKQNQTVVILIEDEERLAKISQTLDDFEIPNIMTQLDSLQREILQIAKGSLSAGFELPDSKLVVLTESELFAKATKKHPARLTMDNTERLKSYTDLKEGDYVVHVNHGVGRFLGIKTMEVDGKHRDYLTLEYQKGAKLYVPVNQLDRVQKYVSADAKPPHLNRLGGTEWQKTKQRVAHKIEDIADELVDLYAEREAHKGFAFPPDDSYQKEFEDAFPYTETPDQLRSTAEIKKDMEKPRPMDRLLIGDVGYGKTEVALRAAFKAIEGEKQVAFLVPTTVLAQQHYKTMLKRFEGFPVKIDILSRFNTRADTKKIIASLKDGTCDIVVGTHRLLSKDIQFKDLGLLIIDEEQRFGVKHKERLKQLKSNVDVLTLTATPIPRTLNMSMLGVRDLSVIETAPTDRYPIQTYVMEQDYEVIFNGIRREMERGGQIFYLHNRVQNIEEKTAELQALVPEARITYIHGQMTENQMEKILMDFIHGDYDVLVTTTIIETGVDMPNVNTLFVENADKIGLAQLYQLRGRVGRSNRVAYAYFMYQPNKVLTEVSEKRLETIKDFTELGSGFKIAMRDLAIRGAGNLLGKQQHGFIDSVGYDLYTQMLNEAVARKRGIKPPLRMDSEINLNIEAYIPSTYISDEQQKIEIYKRMQQLNSFEQYQEIQDDLLDRFGDYPDEVSNLLEVSLLKMYADQALVERIFKRHEQIVIEFSKQATQKLSGQQFIEITATTDLMTNLDLEKDQMNLVIIPHPKQIFSQIILEMQKMLKEVVHKLNPQQEKINEK